MGLARLGIVIVTALTLVNENGDTRHGVPDIAVAILFASAFAIALSGIICLLNAVRMTIVVRRHGWVQLSSSFIELRGSGTPNGQPVVTLEDGDEHWDLTLFAIVWRWRKFQGSRLWFAGKRGRAGVVAPLNGSTMAWAGRSMYTRLLRRAAEQV